MSVIGHKLLWRKGEERAILWRKRAIWTIRSHMQHQKNGCTSQEMRLGEISTVSKAASSNLFTLQTSTCPDLYLTVIDQLFCICKLDQFLDQLLKISDLFYMWGYCFILFYFIIVLGFGPHSMVYMGLSFTLCSGFSPGGAGEICVAGDWTKVSCMQGKCLLPVLAISLIQDYCF